MRSRQEQVQQIAAERDAFKSEEREGVALRILKETSKKRAEEARAAAVAQEQLSAKISTLEGERDQLKTLGSVPFEGLRVEG